MRTDRGVARLERHVSQALQAKGVTEHRALIVAVSGGPDSLALLHALCRLRDGLGLELHGAHLDHALRGEDSEADARFVAETFRLLGLAHTSERADVRAYQRRHRLSLEEAARRVRYDFLARVAREQGAGAVALGHTSDDQAETVLMNIMRGSGLAGLRGMETAARHTIGGQDVLLLRPLLHSTRKDTVHYCDALGLRPRMDRTNLSTAPRRNRVRLELLPAMEQYNPAVRGALIRLSRSAALEVAHLDAMVDGVWQSAVRQSEGCVAVSKDAALRLDPALRAHLLRRAVRLVKGDLKEIDQYHVDSMARLLDGRVGRALDLPGGLRFTVGYTEATVTAAERDCCPLPPLEGEHPLNVPGETLIHGWRVTAALVEPGSGPASNGPREYAPGGLRALLRWRPVAGGLHVRARRPGDRFQPLGMAGRKKLQDFMVDAKVPRRWRDSVPLVLSSVGIVWVVGWRTAEWARAKEADAPLLELVFALESEGGEGG